MEDSRAEEIAWRREEKGIRSVLAGDGRVCGIAARADLPQAAVLALSVPEGGPRPGANTNRIQRDVPEASRNASWAEIRRAPCCCQLDLTDLTGGSHPPA
ncbi:hypothetical protein E0493_09295 [Roseomonas sp. M0104]|uniref:Uncharacterized protein n=1 Tax=Teichococcus coralli TaxID=2545983 RepID=A0A845B7D0_9PROT|nr:hypothetical protein [Pseudoroseomonas coralli]MXP63543.1 hypothetical protein [Pseudoroseomonas coralli]